ncbi:MAG: DNA polymerase sliding clamp [Thermoplasmata archaeon]
MEVKMNVKDIKEITDLLLTLVTEAKFEFSKKGLSVKCVDPAHVAMIVLDLNREAFLEYNLDEETEVGVDLEKIKDFLKNTSSNDVIEIKKEDSKLLLTVGYLSRTMSTIDPSSITVPKVPSLGLPAKAVVPTDQFAGGIKVAENISDNITLHITPNEFRLYSTGDEDSTKLVIPKDLLKELKCDNEVRSLYPVDYLLRFIKAINSEFVTINLGTDYPVKIEFSFSGEKGNGLFLLAPRIEE